MAHSKKGNNNNSSNKYFSKRPPTKAPRKYGLSGEDTKKPGAKTPGKAMGMAPKAAPNSNGPKKRPAVKGNTLPERLLKNPATPRIAGGVCLAAVLVFALWFITYKNAYEVYVADSLEGVIAMNKDVTEKIIYDTALAKLAQEVGSNVSVEQEVTFKPVRANKKELATPEYVIGSIYKKWPYKIEASIITLNGVAMATLKSAKEADETLSRLAANYLPPDAVLVGQPTFEGIEIANKFVDPDNTVSVDAAYAALNTTTEKTRDYDVKSGDNLGKIAANSGMTLDGLLAVNPGLRVDSTLVVGQTISLVSLMPLVTVTTVEEVVRQEIIPKDSEKRENSSQHTSYSQIIQEGADGTKDITEHITRVNGVVVKTEPVSESVTLEPVNEIVEVGTSSVITAR